MISRVAVDETSQFPLQQRGRYDRCRQLAAANEFVNRHRLGAERIQHPTAGRVVGLDYTAWATAIIDLADKPDRITDARQRYAAKGYKAIGGDPLVIGVAEPEVWVIPRAMYERNRANRAARIREAVQDKRMSPTAIMRGTVTQGGEQTFS